ncbi:hypothetical protein KBB08_03575 [Candidatus Gracilibacteria bacterium]|nr:hypothetical protein [Candidatus Gracilibacteria bacterium]
MERHNYWADLEKALQSRDRIGAALLLDRLQVRELLPKESRRSPSTDGLSNVTIDELGATADTRLFLSGWSKKVVHGPDIALVMTNLAAALLQPGEKLTRVEKLNFKTPVQTELRLQAKYKPIGSTTAAVTTKLTTSTKRKIYIEGTPIPQPISGGTWGDRPEIARALLAQPIKYTPVVEPKETTKYSFAINSSQAKLAAEMISPGNQLATSLDLALLCMGVLKREEKNVLLDGYAASCKGFELPDLTLLAEKGTVVFTPIQHRPVGNGWDLVEVHTSFYSGTTAIGGGNITCVCTDQPFVAIGMRNQLLNSEWIVDPLHP